MDHFFRRRRVKVPAQSCASRVNMLNHITAPCCPGRRVVTKCQHSKKKVRIPGHEALLTDNVRSAHDFHDRIRRTYDNETVSLDHTVDFAFSGSYLPANFHRVTVSAHFLEARLPFVSLLPFSPSPEHLQSAQFSSFRAPKSCFQPLERQGQLTSTRNHQRAPAQFLL